MPSPVKGSTIAATIGSSVYHNNKGENLLAKAREQEAKIASLNWQIAASEKALKTFVTEAVAEKKLADAAAAEEKKFGGDSSMASRLFRQMMEDQQDGADETHQEDTGAP
ncbi:hypothetical protein INS49_014028 [Diaporthe citri]|uniref:uncharacterized protein n=1 Tax=Diaporthe citri TaxID=83186 RepID=UPI001C7EF912|nr:uncharacterized protein INS49_014028 [Diaporthe citri]KAG6358144.1 hypothetical protein INS49_014028 [Diaporthe citri]